MSFLAVKKLDDKSFDLLIKELQALIASYSNKWTDHNLSDPGITLIELFSWFSELLLYRIDRLTDNQIEKFLNLIGIYRQPVIPATTEITLQIIEKSKIPYKKVLGRGLKVFTPTNQEDQNIIFETTETITLVTPRFKASFAYTDDLKSSFNQSVLKGYSLKNLSSVPFYVFGKEMQEGRSIYLGFDSSFKPDKLDHFSSVYPIHMTFDITYENPAIKQDYSFDFEQRSILVWEYWSGFGTGWKQLKIQSDGTCALSKSGRLILHSPAKKDHQASSFEELPEISSSPESKEFKKSNYWFRCKLLKNNYEFNPMINNILLNTVSVANTISVGGEILGDSDGMPNQQFSVCYAPLVSEPFLFIKEENRTRLWKMVTDLAISRSTDLHYQFDETRGVIMFGDGINGFIPPTGKNNIIYTTRNLWEILGAGNSLAGQSFNLKNKPVVKNSVELFVYEENEWIAWSSVENFYNSQSYDRHYILDYQLGKITFGNGLHGKIPPYGSQNIACVFYQYSDGVLANVPANSLTGLVTPSNEFVSSGNRHPVTTGSDPETLYDARAKIKSVLTVRKRAVTKDDFEILAKETPGFNIARVICLPMYRQGYLQPAPAVISLIVIPKSENKNPMPGQALKRAVFNHLYSHRLITTQIFDFHEAPKEFMELFILDPQYVQVEIEGKVMAKSQTLLSQVKSEIINTIEFFLSPVGDGSNGSGWTPGRDIYISELYTEIENLNQVEYVHELTAVRRDLPTTTGNGKSIKLRKLELPYVFKIDIDAQHNVDNFKSN